MSVDFCLVYALYPENRRLYLNLSNGRAQGMLRLISPRDAEKTFPNGEWKREDLLRIAARIQEVRSVKSEFKATGLEDEGYVQMRLDDFERLINKALSQNAEIHWE